MRFVDAAKCKYSLGESNKCGICNKSGAHGHLKMLTFLEEIQQFWKADKRKQKGALPKGLWLLRNFAKLDNGRATTKIRQSNFDGFSCCFCMILMIALGDIWWCRLKCWASWGLQQHFEKGHSQRKLTHFGICILAGATATFWKVPNRESERHCSFTEGHEVFRNWPNQ